MVMSPHIKPDRPLTTTESISWEEERRVARTWRQKFGDAFRGFKRGVRGQSSFSVHFFASVTVAAAGLSFGVSLFEWGLLVLCVTIVLAAEMFNSALESMARAITDQYSPHLRDALDIGSAAVLITASGAAVVGTMIFAWRLAQLLGWIG